MVDMLKITIFLVCVDLITFGALVATGDEPTILGASYSQFFDIDPNTETITPIEAEITQAVNTDPAGQVKAAVANVLGLFDWPVRMLQIVAWAAGAMILMPLVILERLQIPFIIKLIVGVPWGIMQMQIVLGIITGRLISK